MPLIPPFAFPLDRQSLFPDKSTHPYYIFAPPYTSQSAGIRVLHLLTHWLNKVGMRASIVLTPPALHNQFMHDLLTPELTSAAVDSHFAEGKTPIVIYPEVISGNPADASCVVRYVLNVPGQLGGDKEFASSEMIYGFSKHLAKLCGVNNSVLHMPVIDTSVFYCEEAEARPFTCFYAMKYQEIHGQTPFGLPPGCIEITRGKRDSQTPAEIADLLRKSRVFYTFENTALATEAVLCGCPVVFMPNRYLEAPIAIEELGWDGYAWGDSDAEFNRARATVSNGMLNYHRSIDCFFDHLETFISATQNRANKMSYDKKIIVPSPNIPYKTLVSFYRSRCEWTFREKLRFLAKVAFGK